MNRPPLLDPDAGPLGWRPPPARAWLLAAAGLGVAGDLLLRAAPGWNLAAWLSAVLLAGVALARTRGPLGAGRAAVLGLGLAAAATLAVRSAPPIQLLAIGLVGLSAGWLLLERPWASGLAARLAALAGAGLSTVALGPVGAASARPTGDDPATWSRRAAVTARGVALAAPVLFVLGALFVSGDPVFARHTERVLEAGLDEALSHLALALALAWVAGGLVLGIAAVRVADLSPAPGPLARWAGEALVALLLVDLLFAAFLGVQARALFGGRAFVEATAGMTYAEYARAGFFQLAVAGMVALPTLLAVDWIVPPGSERRRAFVGLASGLAAGVVLVLASAAHRMALYVEAYGLTEARIYASAFMAWLAIAALWLGGSLVRGRTERFAAGALVAAWGVFLLLVALNPAATVVEVNAGRAASGEGPGFDVRYGVSELGIDAVPALVGALERLAPDERCRVAAHLVERRDRWAGADRRSWTVSLWRARRAIEAREAAIRDAAAPCLGGSYEERRPPVSGSGAAPASTARRARSSRSGLPTSIQTASPTSHGAIRSPSAASRR